MRPAETDSYSLQRPMLLQRREKNDVQYPPDLYIVLREEERENKKQLLLFHIKCLDPAQKTNTSTGRKCRDLAQVFDDVCSD